MTKDMEMSCDERVMQIRGSENIAGYSDSLLALATFKKTPSPSPFAFGEGNIIARIKNILNYKKPAFWVIATSTIAVIILAVVLISNPIKGFSIYEHPETQSLFLGQNSLRVPAMVRIVDEISGDEYILTDTNEIAKVTEIVEEMRIPKKELSKACGGSNSRYSISYYDDINNSISEYRYIIHVAPVWIDNNVKPSFSFDLINQKDILKRLEEVFASKNGTAMYNINSLLENKMQYIGDNAKVVALIDALPLPKGVKRDSIELFTSKAPYGVQINYSLEDDSVQISEEQFLRNSILLLGLINNAEEITHMGSWNNKLLSSTPFKFTYTRADAERIVGGDVRQFAENQESLAELIEIIQMLKNDYKRDEQAVQTLVKGFGKKLQMVSLTAPNDLVAASIAENYSDYVTPELMQKWQADPQSAPGREVSSHWPDRIEILRMERGDTNHYIV